MIYSKSKLFLELKNKFDIKSIDVFETPDAAIYNVLAFILNTNINRLKLLSNIEISQDDLNRINEILDKMVNLKIPFQYITGFVYLYNEKYNVNDKVLIPRSDTELLIENAINIINKNNYSKMLDLCTGSGCIGISVAKNSNIKEVHLIDISNEAIEVANSNIKLNNISTKCKSFVSDLFENLVDLNEKYDIITANPPYITKEEYEELSPFVKNEPYIALVAEDDGLDLYKKIAEQAQNYLNAGGTLMFEIGYKQGEAVRGILNQYDCFTNIKVYKDLNSKDRVISCRFQSKLNKKF
ncbi:MAG: peptide chain release factor N(5)-glutamine methyltransferase [Clostridia bacterium]|nr:peptide chain release factor N(5)-glutamine methyltransferase [Clostridia bacterium]